MVHQKSPNEIILVTKTGRVPVAAAEKEACGLDGPARDDDDFGSDTKRCSCKGFDTDVCDGYAVRGGKQLRNGGLGDQGDVWGCRQLGFGIRQKGSARPKVEDARLYPGCFEGIGLAI